MAETLTQRLHVGGLTPSITADLLRDRFRSFGTVLEVEELGIDPLGQPRPFAFLTLETTQAQLRKCLNVMSGATWRGTVLRIAPAKPKWDAKLEADRRPPPNEEQRKSKRLRRAIVREGGKHAQDMRLATPENICRRKFWINEDGHLIRPIAMRPSHPLPLATDAKPTPKDKAPTRSHCRVIDPRRWKPTHLVEKDLEGDVELPGEEWEFEEAEEEGDVDEQGRVVVGWWKRGEETLEVLARRPRVPDDVEWGEMAWSDAGDESDASELFPTAARSASPLFPGRGEPSQRKSSGSPMFPSRELERSASPLFPTREAEDVSAASSPLFPSRELDEDVEAEGSESAESAAATPDSQPSEHHVEEQVAAVPAATSSAPSVPAVSSQLSTVPNPILAQAESERSGALGVLASLLGDATPTARAGREFIAYEEESDDDDYSTLKPQRHDSEEAETEVPRRSVGAPSPSTPWVYATLDNDQKDPSPIAEASSPVRKPLRLRGGGSGGESASSSSGSGSDSDSGSGSDSDSDSDSSDSDSSDSSDSDSDDDDDEKDAKPAAGLKDLFSSNGPSFSLMNTLAPDMEIDETVVLPTMTKSMDQPELAPLALAPKSTFETDPEINLFFPLPLRPSRNGEAKSVLAEEEQTEQEWGAGSTEYQSYDQPAYGQPTEKFKPKRKAFAREVTDADMQKRWEVRRLELTRGWKRRHREAVKHGRRRGGQDVE